MRVENGMAPAPYLADLQKQIQAKENQFLQDKYRDCTFLLQFF